jgi:hypothetical protein
MLPPEGLLVDARFASLIPLLCSGLLALCPGSAAGQKLVSYRQVVAQAVPGISLASSAVTVPLETSLTFTAKLAGSGSAPSGYVMFLDGTTELSVNGLSQGGVATLSTSSLAAGVHPITAIYQGDSNYTAAVSASVSVTVIANTVPPGFTISATPVSVKPGATTGNISTITVVPSGGFTGTVVLEATIASSPVNAQNMPVLSFGSTSRVILTGTAQGTATLTIGTAAGSSSALAHPQQNAVPCYAAGSSALACILLCCVPARRRRWGAMLGMLVLLASMASGMLACVQVSKSSDGGGSGGSTSVPGTAAGTYTLTILGTSGSSSAKGSVILIVE